MARDSTASSCGSRCWSAAAGRVVLSAAASHSMAGRRSQRGVRCSALSRKTRAYEGERFIEWEFGAGAVAAMPVLEPSAREATLRHHQAVRDAEQFRVGEFDSRARVAIVVEHLDTGGAELGIQALTDLAHAGGFLQIERHQHQLEGRDRIGPDDAALIVV